MIFDINQQLIYKKINELQEKINDIYFVSVEDAKKLNEELEIIENKAISIGNNDVDNSTISLNLDDDSKSIIMDLSNIENKINTILDMNKKEIINLNVFNELMVVDADNKLKNLKYLSKTFRSKRPNKLEINAFSKKLIKELLDLLDNNEMTVDDLEEFSYFLVDIQLIKNIMFLHKQDSLDIEELEIFCNDIKKFNNVAQVNDLFSYYLNQKQLPVQYDFMKDDEEVNHKYLSFYGYSDKKIISDLVYMINGKSIKSFLLTSKIENEFGYYYDDNVIVFTKSKGIKVLEDEAFFALGKNKQDPFFADLIGLYSPNNSVFLDGLKCSNLLFIYCRNLHLDKETDLNSLEYLCICDELHFSGKGNERVHVPKLKEVFFGKNTSNSTFGLDGNYEVTNKGLMLAKNKFK